MIGRRSWIAALAATAAALATAPAGHAAYAPVDRPGPKLSVPASKLAAALVCHGNLAGVKRPVLLVPGTTLTPEVNFSWNYERALAARGYGYCTIELPNHGMTDVQVAGEYVVSAIRTMAVRSRHKVDVIGFSQGGMVPRWALRFWPDTRALVNDVVGLDPSNHGTLDAYPVCAPGCSESIWQQGTGSNFLGALNSFQETFAGISYTVAYTIYDEVVTPNLPAASSSSLKPGPGRIRNVAVQSICPANVSEHLIMGTSDPVGWALALDAITHDGPADPARVSRTVCLQPFMPGVNPATALTDFARVLATAGQQLLLAPKVAKEPALRSYTRG